MAAKLKDTLEDGLIGPNHLLDVGDYSQNFSCLFQQMVVSFRKCWEEKGDNELSFKHYKFWVEHLDEDMEGYRTL